MRIDEVISCDVARALEIISKAPSIRFACRFVPVANRKLPFANNSLIDDASDQLDGQGAATIFGADIRVSSRGRERTTESGRELSDAIGMLNSTSQEASIRQHTPLKRRWVCSIGASQNGEVGHS